MLDLKYFFFREFPHCLVVYRVAVKVWCPSGFHSLYKICFFLSGSIWDLLFIPGILKLYDLPWCESLKIHYACTSETVWKCVFWFWIVFLYFLYLLPSTFLDSFISWMWIFWLLFLFSFCFLCFPVLLRFNWHSLTSPIFNPLLSFLNCGSQVFYFQEHFLVFLLGLFILVLLM